MFVFLPTWGWWLLRAHHGKREASWRMWFLIFLPPICFFCASAFLACIALAFVTYSPVFRYEFTDGSLTEASTGQSSPNWNFEVGSIHEILYRPDRKADVKLDSFEAIWALPSIIAGIAVAALLPSFLGAILLLRWLRGGAQTIPSRKSG